MPDTTAAGSGEPELWVCYCGETAPPVRGSFPHPDCQGGRPVAAARDAAGGTPDA
jgi:hypothetical protein